MHRLVIALVILLGLTGAAFVAAYLLLFSASTDRAATLAPAQTAAYVNVYLQPSTGQQMNLSGLIGRLPGFADEATLDEKVDQVVQNLLVGSGIDYRQQVKPWLGNQVAIALWPGDDAAEATGALIAEVKDRAAAEASIDELISQEGAALTTESYGGVELQIGTDGAYAFVGEMLVIGTDQASLKAVVDVSGDAPSLAEQDRFRSAMAALPQDHLASTYLDLAAIAEETGTAGQFESFSTASGVLVAERDGLRFSGSAPYDMAEAAPSARDRFALGSEPSSLVDWMPEETLAEVVIFGLGQTLADAEAAAATTPEGQELSSALDTVRAIAAFGLGIDFDADVLPLLDREVAIAVGGLEGTPSGQLLLRPEDADEARAALDRVVERLEAVGASSSRDEVEDVEIVIVTVPDIGEVAYAVVDGIVIMGMGSDDVTAAIEAHRHGTSLGASETYRQTFELAGARAGTELWADVDALVDVLDAAGELPDDARDILLQIGTVGLTMPSRDDQIEFHVVVTVEPAGSAE